MIPPPQSGQASLPQIVFIGGFGDSVTRQVVRVVDELRPLLPGHVLHYFGHWQWVPAARLVAGLPAGGPLILVGHSWGANRAVRLVLANPGRVRRLATIDPVGWQARYLVRRLRGAVPEWINVQATGGGAWEASNIVARIGRPYGALATGAAHLGLLVPVPHRDVRGMLLARVPPPDGRSVLQRIIAA